MAFRITTFNLLRPGHRCLSRSACSSSSNMVVRVTTCNLFFLGHTSALLPLTWRFELQRVTRFPLGIPVPLLPLTWQFKLRRAIMRPIMRAIMRPNYFFVQDCFSVGTACVFIAFIAAPYASGRRSLQTVGIFWTKYQAIRCLQYGVGKKELAQRGGRQSPAALRAKITPFCR